MQNLADLHLSDLNDDESWALHAYKAARDVSAGGVSLCFGLNEALRLGLWAAELSAELRRAANALDSVFERTPRLATPLTVYRGIGTRHHIPATDKEARFRSLEYWSTATSELSVEKFLKPVHTPALGAILCLKLPAGFPAYNMETLEGAGGSESELLLPRSIIWTVRGSRLLSEGRVSALTRSWFENIALIDLEPPLGRRPLPNEAHHQPSLLPG